MKRQLSLISAALIATSLAAQEKAGLWTLEQCILFGLEHNISVQQREISVDNNAVALKTTKASRLPSLSANIGENVNFGRSQNRQGVYEDHSAATTNIGANAQVAVFQGFRINNQIKADRLALEAACQDLEQAKQDLSLQITGAFLQVLHAKEQEAVAQKQVDINAELLEKTKKLVSAGRSSESDLYDAESSLASAQSDLVNARNSVETSILDLVQEINYDGEASFDVIAADSDAMVDRELLLMTPPDEIYKDYIDRRPSVIAAQKRVDQANAAIKVAKSSYWPSINLGVSYGTGYYSDQKIASGNGTFWNQLGSNGSTSIGASLSIPIFNRLATSGSVRQARNNAKIQQLALEQTKLDVYKEVQQAYVNAKSAFSQYQAGIAKAEAARKAFAFEQKKYDNGRSTAYQFNEVRLKLFAATAEMTQNKYAFLLRAKILDFYKGEPLF